MTWQTRLKAWGHLDRRRLVKYLLIAAAVAIAAGSLAVSQSLISDLRRGEQADMETWAEAMRSLIKADEQTDLSLVLKVINGNHTIPVIVLDETGGVVDYRNVPLTVRDDTLTVLHNEALEMKRAGRVMYLDLPQAATGGATFSVCYGESLMLQRLAKYPYIQLGVVTLFIAIAFFALLSSKRAEQNKVWVGLSRETAHQLGTPISSLMAWTEMLRETYPNEPIVEDLTCDVNRLQLVAERFSKIGSAPSLIETDLVEAVSHATGYMSRRVSGRVNISVIPPADGALHANLGSALFEWVVENLCKNAIDAMSGIGRISITLYRVGRWAVIEVTDTGKGIPKSKFKTVFRPGFTTKKRGWGLGLSLAKRIIEQYHGGSIFVKSSEIGVGTTFCIRIPACPAATITP